VFRLRPWQSYLKTIEEKVSALPEVDRVMGQAVRNRFMQQCNQFSSMVICTVDEITTCDLRAGQNERPSNCSWIYEAGEGRFFAKLLFDDAAKLIP
jgi:hypothetical protein